MATPDFQKLYELYRQISGERIRSASLPLSDGSAQSRDPTGVIGTYSPTGGVLGYLSTTPAPTPIGLQRAMPVPIGFRSPQSGNHLGLGRGLPMPGGSTSVQDIPDPHLERLVPEWMQRFWTAGTLIPKIMAGEARGRVGVDGASPGSEASRSHQQPQTITRKDRSGGIGWYVAPNPNDRILSRVEGDEVESPPLAPEDPTDAVDEEACAEEWSAARKACEEGFRGPRGKSPYSIPKGPRGRNYTVDDCARGIVSEICGGNAVKHGLSGGQRAKRNNKEIQQKRKDPGQQ